MSKATLKWLVKFVASIALTALVLALLRPEDYCTGLRTLESAANDARAAADNARQDAERAEDEVGPIDSLLRLEDWRKWKVLDEKAEKLEVLARGTEQSRDSRATTCAEKGLQPPPESDVSKIKETFLAQLPVAFWIVVAAFLVPMVIKVVFYFWLAPAAGRLPPIRLDPRDDMPQLEPPAGSATSLVIDISPNEEAVLLGGFIQSSSTNSQKATEWFLNKALPLSSAAAGMVLLTRIRPTGTSSTRVVVSSQKDPLTEVAAVSLPAGASVILQARSLVGVVRADGQQVKITPRWRFRSLHAWLTLQFRFLAFEGPCKLIVQGCRGVRAERPDSTSPRLINQAATLGFSPTLEYSNTRCETFLSYLRGEEDLFNDMFTGGRGWFLYEEIPAGHRQGGLTGRGLEGVVDAFLKAFGI